MKGKQLVAVIVACIIVIVTGLIGVAGAVAINNTKTDSKKMLKEALSLFDTSSINYDLPDEDYIGRINIEGTIQGTPDETSFFTGNIGYNHNLNMDFVDKMANDSKNKGIFLYVDSPGGTVYHSDEMYLKLMEYKERTGRPIYAYFANQACSGAYYISMAADKIYANRNCWTGSIGVIISTYNFKKLFDKLGVEEINIVSGNNKAMGSSGEEMTEENREIFQSLVDEAFDQFVGIVCDGRNMPESEVRRLADGRIYTALQAKEAGLIDEISGYDDAVVKIGNDTGVYEEEFFTPNPGNPFRITSFFSAFKKSMDGRSDSELRAAMDLMDKFNDRELMYYAK